jgi:hypothetical protein
MKQFLRRRPAPTRSQVHQQLNRFARRRQARLAVVPPASRDQHSLFDWIEEELSAVQGAA